MHVQYPHIRIQQDNFTMCFFLLRNIRIISLPPLNYFDAVLLIGHHTQLSQGLKQEVTLQHQVPLRRWNAFDVKQRCICCSVMYLYILYLYILYTKYNLCNCKRSISTHSQLRNKPFSWCPHRWHGGLRSCHSDCWLTHLWIKKPR